jgi:hypothetical protein
MCHPYRGGLPRRASSDFTKVDLNWFFDQWIETDKRIDYAVRGVKHPHADGGQLIHLRRKGDLQMPIDLRIIARDGSAHDFHIPNNWFVKKTTARMLPRWISYDELQRDYIAQVDIPSGIEDVIIDPTDRLADAYKVNDRLNRPVSVQLDHHVKNRADRKNYEVFVRP